MKNILRESLGRFPFSLTLIGLVSCNLISAPVAPTFTLTEPPISQGLTLTSITVSETSALPVYTLKALVLFLTGSNDPRVQEFNQEVAALVQQEVDGFKLSMASAPNPTIAIGSFF